ncbi:MAG: MaoC/PaaZ C-terminal domain-containing protein [Christensenellales bacterium]|jgi:3-hydroxybutyryl-CoA dehydratase
MYFEDYEIGKTYSIQNVHIDEEKLLSFAQEYDPLPVHLDEEYAQTTPFRGLIAPGVMSFMTFWRRFLDMNVLTEGLIAGKSTKIEWLAPVYPGDVLSGEVRITNLTARNKYNGVVEVTVDVFNQKGVQVMRDVTEAVVKKRQTT